jgi:DNA-binding NtrC family response regulator
MNPARVLVVDDEPFARLAYSEWLRKKNFHVIEAKGGQEAIERIRRDTPDIVISDMVMPGMDGLQLLKEARTHKADIPFLMITGFASHSTAVKVLQQGASDFLAKPFKPEELAERVRRTLLESSRNKPLASAKGMILGGAISAILWGLIVRALSVFIS